MLGSMTELGPGWIAFGPIGGGAGGLVGLGQILVAPWKSRLTWRTWWRIRHTGIITQAHGREWRETGGDAFGPTMVEAQPGGMREITLRTAKHWTDEWTYILPRYQPGQADLVAEIAQRQARKRIPYAFECYPAIALNRLPVNVPPLNRWLSRTDADGDPVRVICSWEVDSALTLSGGLDGLGHVFNDGRQPHDVIPSELYLRLLELDPVKVIRPGRVAVTRRTANLRDARTIPPDLL